MENSYSLRIRSSCNCLIENTTRVTQDPRRSMGLWCPGHMAQLNDQSNRRHSHGQIERAHVKGAVELEVWDATLHSPQGRECKQNYGTERSPGSVVLLCNRWPHAYIVERLGQRADSNQPEEDRHKDSKALDISIARNGYPNSGGCVSLDPLPIPLCRCRSS
jgi:hypothetical protein